MIKKTRYFGIYEIWRGNKKLPLTKSLDNKTFFNENLIDEYREFSPFHSKLSAAVMKGINFWPFKEDSVVLYLGAAHGFTPSFISDICNKGFIFCIEFAPLVARKLVEICEIRKNMIPILADADKPEEYKNKITNVDIIYQDIAQKNQVEILFKNLQFLEKKGYVILVIKARSIDVTKNPSVIYNEVRNKLKQKLKILDCKILDPFERDHAIFVCQKI